MSVKSEMLRLLEQNRGKSLSGEQIAESLGVTRAAVWKAVKSLKEEGYEIEGVNRKGYMLAGENDILSSEGIVPFLDRKHEVVVLPSIDSTNEEVKRRAMAGADAGLVVVSDEQSAGKGRRGRGFFSPKGSGIYMSMLFRPQDERAEDIVLVTTQAAVAVSLAIEEVYGKETSIKWVNDVMLSGKKVCGILTEAISDFESGGIDLVVVGIGINVREPAGGLPEEIKNIAGYILKSDSDPNIEKGQNENISNPPRNRLVAAVVNHLFDFYEALPDTTYLEEYRRRSNVIGKGVIFEKDGVQTEGDALDINERGGLVVRLTDGSEEILHTGEISLRTINRII